MESSAASCLGAQLIVLKCHHNSRGHITAWPLSFGKMKQRQKELLNHRGCFSFIKLQMFWAKGQEVNKAVFAFHKSWKVSGASNCLWDLVPPGGRGKVLGVAVPQTWTFSAGHLSPMQKCLHTCSRGAAPASLPGQRTLSSRAGTAASAPLLSLWGCFSSRHGFPFSMGHPDWHFLASSIYLWVLQLKEIMLKENRNLFSMSLHFFYRITQLCGFIRYFFRYWGDALNFQLCLSGCSIGLTVNKRLPRYIFRMK